ncbi:unnamed protein product [Gulo gulo]|uniref:60S ribosomal protein L13a n=1 Tax=Gulo gulo TaxID=48420 RepID=A0A9X9Q2A9_GULGU|nr:unnamed protein product [Gulo gulo]
MVLPAALTAVRMKPTRKWVFLGCLAHEVGWKYQAVAATLEDKRKEKAKTHYQKKKPLMRLQIQTEKNVERKTDIQGTSRSTDSWSEPIKCCLLKQYYKTVYSSEKVYLFERERGSTHMRSPVARVGEGAEGEGEKERESLKHTGHCTSSPRWGSISQCRDHDLSRNQELDTQPAELPRCPQSES